MTDGAIAITLVLNGEPRSASVSPRLLLADLLRDAFGLTGARMACGQGPCGACTVQVDGEPVRGCLMLAAQVDGRAVRTVEGLAGPDGALHPLQAAFAEAGALQCGFCTPGFLMLLEPLVAAEEPVDEVAVRRAASANLCRCTGYDGIVRAVGLARERRGAA
jgi:carbon-monoxide dehydrogenase small subunit